MNYPAPTQLVRMRTIDILKGIAILALILTPIGWLFRAAMGARAAARASQCHGNLFYIAFALRNYESTYGAFPPAHVTDARGRPLYSWRVLILPFMDSKPLYDRFRLDEPWDGPNNSKLIAEMPDVYNCPNHRPDDRDAIHTDFVAVTGHNTLFPGASTRSMADLQDDPRQTLMLAEVADIDIPWTAPIDLNVDEGGLDSSGGAHPFLSSPDPNGPGVSTADGRFRRLGRPLPSLETLRALTTINGGETIDWP